MPITVTRDLSQSMRHVVHVRNHAFAVDASLGQGGSDTRPDAHDLYDAAVSSCKALTLVWFARHKGIPLTDMRIVTERDSSEERNGVYRLHTVLHLSGELNDEQRQALLAVADKCPVHKLMTELTTEITTSLFK